MPVALDEHNIIIIAILMMYWRH